MIGFIPLSDYQFGVFVVFACIIVGFFALMRETEDIHRLLLTDLAEILSFIIIALVATDLAEALILPGIVVGIAELIALAEILTEKEGWSRNTKPDFRIEIMDSAPAILAFVLLIYGVILSGFTGGAVAGVGIIFYFMCKGDREQFEMIEILSGYAWVIWLSAFFVFMILPSYWFFAVMLAGAGIFVKVAAKFSLIGTGGEQNV